MQREKERKRSVHKIRVIFQNIFDDSIRTDTDNKDEVALRTIQWSYSNINLI